MNIIKGGKWWRFRLRMQLSSLRHPIRWWRYRKQWNPFTPDGMLRPELFTREGWHRTGTLTDDGVDR
ncbi:hypothetical protein ABVN64_30195 [Mycolicibacterium conceptionense]|uniref:hypothetical protein n=1 Tax=Mycolicibacterium conceptionense TaxID=451644 RepID=UPI00336B5350